mgnify:CR=1 FL=1
MARSRNVSFYGPSQAPLGGNKIQRDYASDPRNQMFRNLMQQGVGSVQSPMEGMLKALNMGVGGYFAGQAEREMLDREDRRDAGMAEALGAMSTKPWINPDTGTAEIEREVPSVGAAQLQPSLTLMEDEVKTTPSAEMVPTGPAGGYEGAMTVLDRLQNPDLSGFKTQLALQKYQQEDTARREEVARLQGITDQKDMYKFQQNNKSYPPTKQAAPKTIKTAEGVYILNPDGTRGTRLGGAKADTEIIMGGAKTLDLLSLKKVIK